MLICGRNAYTALPIAIIAIKIEKTDAKISSRMANILSWIAAALLGAASAVVLALLVWNGFLYPEYLRQPPLARPFSHGSFAPVGDDDDWTFKPQFAENAAVSFGSSGASATRYGRIEDVHILPIVVAECEGGVPPRTMYLETVDWATSKPSIAAANASRCGHSISTGATARNGGPGKSPLAPMPASAIASSATIADAFAELDRAEWLDRHEIHRAGYLCLEALIRETTDAADARLAIHKLCPIVRLARAERGDHAHAGHDHNRTPVLVARFLRSLQIKRDGLCLSEVRAGLHTAVRPRRNPKAGTTVRARAAIRSLLPPSAPLARRGHGAGRGGEMKESAQWHPRVDIETSLPIRPGIAGMCGVGATLRQAARSAPGSRT